MKYISNGPNGRKETEFGCITAIAVIIGVCGLIALIWKGLHSSLSWFDSLPWYIYFPLGAAIIYVIFKFGQSRNWWN